MGTKKARGATAMREKGYRLVQLWFDPGEWALIEAAAARDKKKVATWIRTKAFHAAEIRKGGAR
jgi:hypothetical protein